MGEDIFRKATWINSLTGPKTLISCSSEDKEFLSLLRLLDWQGYVPDSNPFQTVPLDLPNCTLRILRGGFHINFDGSPESVQSTDIQMTRGLLLGGILQAAFCERGKWQALERGEMLDPAIQQLVVTKWLKQEPSRVPNGMH